MIRRLNYTGRRRIRREDAKVSLHEGSTFSLALNLDRYRLPEKSRIFIEAYRPATSSYKRFDWGTIQEPKPAPYRGLSEFGGSNGFLFRVKVVDSSERQPEPARLLAAAERLRPVFVEHSPRQAFSLLDIVPTDDLAEIWRIDFSENEEPVLLVNSNIVESPNALVRSDAFVALVLPQVLRQILSRILLIDQFDVSEDESDWRHKWIRLCERLPGVPRPPSPEIGDRDQLDNAADIEDWTNEAVAAFVRKFHIDRTFGEWWGQEEAA